MNLKVKLKNIARFVDKTISFENSFNLMIIASPNGIGKTSLLKAISCAYSNSSDPEIVGPHSDTAEIELAIDGKVYNKVLKKGARPSLSSIKGGISYNFDDLLNGNIFTVISEAYNDKIMKLAKTVNVETTDVEYAIKQVEKSRSDKRSQLSDLQVFNKTEKEMRDITTTINSNIKDKQKQVIELEKELSNLSNSKSLLIRTRNRITSMEQEISNHKSSLPDMIKSKAQVKKKIERLSTENITHINYNIFQLLENEGVLSKETKENIEEKLEMQEVVVNNEKELEKMLSYHQTFNKIEAIETEIDNERNVLSSVNEDGTTDRKITEIQDDLNRLRKNISTLEKRKYEIAFNMKNFNTKIELEKRLSRLDRTLNDLLDIKKNIMKETNDHLDIYNERLSHIIGYKAEVEKTTIKTKPIKLKMTDINDPERVIYFKNMSDGEKIVAIVLLLSEHAVRQGLSILIFDRFESVSFENRQKLARIIADNYPEINYIFSAVDSIYPKDMAEKSDIIYLLNNN